MQAVQATDEFTSAMQQYTAEAETGFGAGTAERMMARLGEMLSEFRMLNARVDRLENVVVAAFEKIAALNGPSPELVSGFQKLEEQLSALRESETVNHRLFDSMHDELIRYRDNFLHESLQKPFIRDLVILYDDLSAVASQLENGSAPGAPQQSRQNLQNALHSLIEILHRLEVTEIEPRERVDRRLHRVLSYEPAQAAEENGRIIMRVKRGFLWRDKVLRPEEVIATRFE